MEGGEWVGKGEGVKEGTLSFPMLNINRRPRAFLGNLANSRSRHPRNDTTLHPRITSQKSPTVVPLISINKTPSGHPWFVPEGCTRQRLLVVPGASCWDILYDLQQTLFPRSAKMPLQYASWTYPCLPNRTLFTDDHETSERCPAWTFCTMSQRREWVSTN